MQSNLAGTFSLLRRQITKVKRMVSQWVGQLQFQNEIMQLEGACLIKGVSSPAFRHASPIKPWRACDTVEEHLDAQHA